MITAARFTRKKMGTLHSGMAPPSQPSLLKASSLGFTGKSSGFRHDPISNTNGT